MPELVFEEPLREWLPSEGVDDGSPLLEVFHVVDERGAAQYFTSDAGLFLLTDGMIIVDNSESLEMTIGSPCWSPVDEAVMMEMIVDSGFSRCKVNICKSSLFF